MPPPPHNPSAAADPAEPRLPDAGSGAGHLAAGQLLPLVYDDLRGLAAARLAHEAPGLTLQATALVHEAYMRIVGPDPDRPWDGRGHFVAAASEAMRRILIDRARHKATVKQGGPLRRLDLDDVPTRADSAADRRIALDEALAELGRRDAMAARLVELRYFAGFSHQEAADSLGISRRAADRLWALARAWLFRRLAGP